MDEAFSPCLGREGPATWSASCEVLLTRIEVMADIGVLASEAGVAQPLQIEVAAAIVPPTEDELSQTLDYSLILEYARKIAAERTCLIETFARRLAGYCLAHDCVLSVDVRIDKPQAVPGCLAGTRVRMSKCGT